MISLQKSPLVAFCVAPLPGYQAPGRTYWWIPFSLDWTTEINNVEVTRFKILNLPCFEAYVNLNLYFNFIQYISCLHFSLFTSVLINCYIYPYPISMDWTFFILSKRLSNPFTMRPVKSCKIFCIQGIKSSNLFAGRNSV